MNHRTIVVAACFAAALACNKSEESGDKASSSSASSATTPTASAQSPVATPAPAPSASSIPAPPDVAAAPADATKTASGLASKVLTAGTGKDHPTASDRVKVNYT